MTVEDHILNNLRMSSTAKYGYYALKGKRMVQCGYLDHPLMTL